MAKSKKREKEREKIKQKGQHDKEIRIMRFIAFAAADFASIAYQREIPTEEALSILWNHTAAKKSPHQKSTVRWQSNDCTDTSCAVEKRLHLYRSTQGVIRRPAYTLKIKHVHNFMSLMIPRIPLQHPSHEKEFTLYGCTEGAICHMYLGSNPHRNTILHLLKNLFGCKLV